MQKVDALIHDLISQTAECEIISITVNHSGAETRTNYDGLDLEDYARYETKMIFDKKWHRVKIVIEFANGEKLDVVPSLPKSLLERVKLVQKEGQ